jgi:hypothetical protein
MALSSNLKIGATGNLLRNRQREKIFPNHQLPIRQLFLLKTMTAMYTKGKYHPLYMS